MWLYERERVQTTTKQQCNKFRMLRFHFQPSVNAADYITCVLIQPLPSPQFPERNYACLHKHTVTCSKPVSLPNSMRETTLVYISTLKPAPNIFPQLPERNHACLHKHTITCSKPVSLSNSLRETMLAYISTPEPAPNMLLT